MINGKIIITHYNLKYASTILKFIIVINYDTLVYSVFPEISDDGCETTVKADTSFEVYLDEDLESTDFGDVDDVTPTAPDNILDIFDEDLVTVENSFAPKTEPEPPLALLVHSALDSSAVSPFATFSRESTPEVGDDAGFILSDVIDDVVNCIANEGSVAQDPLGSLGSSELIQNRINEETVAEKFELGSVRKRGIAGRNGKTKRQRRSPANVLNTSTVDDEDNTPRPRRSRKPISYEGTVIS